MGWLLFFVASVVWAQSSAEWITLGRKLFFDGRLSADGTISCGSCHDPKQAFADGRRVAVGIHGRKGERHTPALINRGFGETQFWDGRAASLEKQVLDPIRNPKEMDMTVEEAIGRVERAPEYQGVVGGGWTPSTMSRALAAYVATIQSVDSPLDRYLRGEEGALTPPAREGFRLFRDKARCYICHSGNHFTDELFHNTGVAWKGGRLRDEGRFGVTGKVYHRGAFKTPTLREIANSAPYMHDGSIGTLEEVVEFYDKGGNRNPHLDENMEPLRLNAEEKGALVAFLRSLSGTIREGR